MKRLLAVFLIAGQILLGLPAGLFAADERPGPAPAPRVNVNRSLPKMEAVDLTLQFSEAPSDAEMFRARVFEEPLGPVGGVEDPRENKVLAEVLLAYARRTTVDDASAVEAFLAAHPESRWRPSLLLNLGLSSYWSGRFSKALALWEETWGLTKADESPFGRAIADRAVGEIAAMNARVGRAEVLEALFAEVKDRDIRGPATAKLDGARDGLKLMRERPEVAFRCGPYALDRIRASTGAGAGFDARILATPSTAKGLSLARVHALSRDLKMRYRMAKRKPGSAVIVPAVAHWKIGHFGALVNEKDGRYLVLDPTFGDDIWTSPAALDEESSGYFLIPAGRLPEGWEPVGAEEGATVWGKGHLTGKDPKETEPCDQMAKEGGCGGGGGGGMAVWDVHALLVSLNLVDTPVGYTPPVGPAVHFTATYNHREYGQPSTFTYSNLGHKWTHNWLSFLVDDPNNDSAGVTRATAGGGSSIFSGYDAASRSYATHPKDQSILKRVSGGSSPRYEMQMPDGSTLVYAQPDGATSFPRRVFLTDVLDPQGNAVTLTYDSYNGGLRLRALRDAIGQVTTISYLAGDPLKISQVTDPFGRSAHFRYNAGQLIEIEDVIGMKSQFAYGKSDFAQALTTPYGTTRFYASSYGSDSLIASLEIVDPLGQRERVEFSEHAVQLDPPSALPSGIPLDDATRHEYEAHTIYWNKGAVSRASNAYDYGKAKVIGWVRGSGGNAFTGMGIKSMERRPLENGVFYFYDGQPRTTIAGATSRPNRIARVLKFDAATNTKTEENHLYQYNAIGHSTRYTDPLGRETVYEYAANNIDLTAIKQKNGAVYDRLWSATYNGQHQPLTVADASGQTTSFTYNARGQLETVTTPARAGVTENRTTTLVYDTFGYLQSVTGPTAGSTVSFTYDGYGRPRTITNADDYTVTLEYDDFDRPKKVHYPNGTYEEVTWDKLDIKKYRDLMGRVTEIFYDAIRRPTAVRDPMNRTTNLVWCGCGGLERIIDANGNATSFVRDTAGRVIRETRADGSYMARTYETTTSRVASVSDPRARRAYTYNVDGTLSRVDYLHAATGQPDPNTPPVAFTYDPAYRRLAIRLDRVGTPAEAATTYAYNPVTSAVGSGRLVSIDGPLANDTITYAYDELGRVKQRAINGVSTSVAYDTLGRVSNVTNPLGSFDYGYDGNTSRLLSVGGPNGLRREYSYFDNAGDRQLQQITNRFGTNVLSRFAYTYNADNEIATWTQETGGDPATAQRYSFGYDAAQQLTSAVLSQVASGTLLKSFAYSYDKSFNRTSEQIDSAVTSASYNKGDQLTNLQTGGSMVFEGTTTEPATITVAGKPAQTTSDGRFRGTASVTSGTNTVTVAATDASNNTRTYTYPVTVSGGNATLTYDSAGNLLSDGVHNYEWDLASRLLAINQGSKRSEFTYDGLHRRTRIVEKDGGTVTSDKRYLWAGTRIVEERDATTNATLKRYFGDGVQQGSQNLFHTRDHLGSIREVVDSSGAIRARYDYDPYGRRTKVAGDLDVDLGFTGHWHHGTSGLDFAVYRAYDSNLGRWLSRDPLGRIDGPNLYAYVHNDPVNYVDPSGGLAQTPLVLLGPWGWAAMAALALAAYAMTGEDNPRFVREDSLIDIPDPRQMQRGNNELNALDRKCNRLRGKDGRFVTDPANPPSPFQFTDAQRRAAWRKLAQDPTSPLTAEQRVEIEERGWRGPQRINPRTGEVETMELSHEPIPLREGGTEVVPRWPEDHASIDPHRRLKMCTNND